MPWSCPPIWPQELKSSRANTTLKWYQRKMPLWNPLGLASARAARLLVERFHSSNHMGRPKRPHSVDGKSKMQLSGFMEIGRLGRDKCCG
jgi:hypothetical protein